MRNKIEFMAKSLNLSKELNNLSISEDVQILQKKFDKDKDIICFVRLRNKADIKYPDNQEVPTQDGFVLVYSQDFINDFALNNNLSLELSAMPDKILAVAKLSKKIDLPVFEDLKESDNTNESKISEPKKQNRKVNKGD